MAEYRDGAHGQVFAIHRLILAALVVLALVTGYLGFADFLHGNTLFGHGPLDLIYDDLQLFVLGPFPLQQGGTDLPVLLQIGRLAAPLVTVFAFIEAGRVFLAAELRRWRIQRMRGHVVVCGSGTVAGVLARKLTATGDPVVVVAAESVDGARRGDVVGDPRLPEVLRAAAVHRARRVYACTDDTATNTAIALAAARTAATGGPDLVVYVYAPDPELCLAMQARHLGRTRTPRVRVEFFNVDEVAARKLVADQRKDAPSHVLVIGASVFGRALVVELARHWRATRSCSDVRPSVVLADRHASTAVAEICHRYQFVGETCALRPHDGTLTQLLGSADSRSPTTVFVCLDDDENCLRTALTADTLWHSGPHSVTVRLTQLAGFPEVFHGTEGDPLLDTNDGVLRLFDVVDAACDPALIHDDLVERLARVVHDRYRRAVLERGVQVGSPATAPWDHLPEVFRRSCRSQAEDIKEKLRRIGCTLAPRVVVGDTLRLGEGTIEVLARMEHQRWMAEKLADGWSRGPRDEAGRRHPDLVPWEELPTEEQDKNLKPMRDLGDIVGDAGFRIIQL